MAAGAAGSEQSQGVYHYNYAGMRIRHLGSDRGDVEYIYDDQSIVDEVVNGTNTALAHYRYGDRLLSLNSAGNEQFYHYASLGTTANLSNSAGENQIAYRVDPFGEITHQEGSSVNRQVFTGHEHDTETGLIYMKARFYDPDVGRFMNQDTYLGEHGTPPSLHRYLYAYSNPTVYVDADGHVAGLDETGQYLMDTGKELLNHVDEDSSWYETAFFGITAGANYFVGGVVETVNFGLNIVGNEGVLGSRVQERAQSELDEAFGTIQFISENKTQVAQNLFSSARTTLSEAASGNSKAQAELVAFATGMVGLKGQNSLLSANRTAAVVNAAKTVSSAVKGSKVAVSATKTIERAVVAGGNRATQLANSAATGVKKAAVKVANAAKSGRLNPLNYKPEYGTLGMNGSKMKFVPPKKP